jgi:hypothetical protein
MGNPIVRKCSVDFTTPAGGINKLPINCAVDDSEKWPWKYFYAKTLGTRIDDQYPVSENGLLRGAGASFTVDGYDSKGQTVLRGFFAYVATNDITVSVTLRVNADGGDPGPNASENIKLIGRLYNPSGNDVVQEYFNETYANEVNESIILPATVCPKILWLGAAIQPAGYNNGLEGLPITEASIQFN